MIPSESYRLLIFRYVFLIGMGVYAWHGYKLNFRMSFLITATGAIFITVITYFNYTPRIVNKAWAGTNFISSMLIVPLMVWLIQNANIKFAPLELLGRASYNIFLVQMVYYRGYYEWLGAILHNRICHLILGFFLCILVGILFYLIETPITKKVIGRLFGNKGKV